MRLNCVSGSVLALGATTLLTASAAFGQCVTTCPIGGIQQNDACGGLDPDPNGGCNFSPVQYQDIGALGLGSPLNVCGTVGTFGEAGRDLDWYRFSLAAPSVIRVTASNLDSNGVQATNFTMFIINGDNCNTQITEFAAASGACPFISPDVALPPGNHIVILTVNSFAPDPPACPVTYKALIEVVEELPEQCGGSESCTEVHASGGCENFVCCGQVCAFNPDCCTTGWDQSCVDLAVKLCGLFIYDCVSPGGAPANDCATNPATIACGATAVAFNTTNAGTDGPPNAQCTYGKDIWYVIQFDQVGGGELQIDVNSATWDSTIALYALGASSTFDPNTLPALFVGCVDVQGDGFETAVLVDAVEDDYYLIQIAGFDAGSGPDFGTGDINITCRRVVFNTGITSTVQFDSTNMGNYAVTNLGWSSGNLNAANAQRWAAQPFIVPDPGAGLGWNITAIHGYGFTPVGVLNEELCYKVWKRFAFTTAPNPANAPNYELVSEGCVIYPTPTDVPGGPATEDFEINVDFPLAAGDYWLTIYANNPSGAIPSNWAWFTNAQGGIGYSPDNNGPGIWRSQLFPVPGFIVYRLPATTLAPVEGDDPTKLYANGFRIVGAKRSVSNPCPWDLNGDGVVDGGDLGILLSSWNNPFGGGELGELLAAWGPCPPAN